MKINDIIGEFKIGEVIVLFLTNGLIVEGDIIGINEDSIKMQTSTQTLTIFEVLIGGWARPSVNKINIINNEIKKQDNVSIEEPSIEISNVYLEKIKEKSEIEKLDEDIKQSSHDVFEEKLVLLPDEENERSSSGFIAFEIEDIPWKEDGLPDEDMFKGRGDLLDDLLRHYRSNERKKTYVLYGLTRTGKSSILRYFSEAILNKEIKIDRNYKFIPFLWDLSRAASQSNAKDMWNYLLQNSTADRINTFRSREQVNLPDTNLLHLNDYRIKHLNELIEYLKVNGYFPIFLIDEFSYYKELVKSRKIDASFVANFRQLSYSNLACFVYAGTYNLRRLVSDPTLSITGQFTNTIEMGIGQIDIEPATELILAFQHKVDFTKSAIDQILELSNRIPYFIQIICKNAAFYCFENRINKIDSGELEEVVKILVSEKPKRKGSYIQKISEGAFGNNQFDPTDTKGMVTLSSICYLSNGSGQINGVGYAEIADLWVKNGLHNPNMILKETMEDLIEKGVLVKNNIDNMPTYKIGVTLFSRWWNNEKSNDIRMEISKLIEN